MLSRMEHGNFFYNLWAKSKSVKAMFSRLTSHALNEYLSQLHLHVQVSLVISPC